MTKNTLPVDFKDDIMNSSMGGKRRYRMINNSDGTISLEDATTYDQVGSNFGAAQLNATNQAVNAAADAGKIIDDIDAINNVTQEGYIAGARALKRVNNSLGGLKFGVDANGNYGYYKAGADSVTPFKTTKVYNLGTGTSFDIKSKFPDIYTSLSINNFIVAYNSITVSTYYHGGGTTVASGYSASTTKNANLNITKYYNNSTGILTISGISNSASYYPFKSDQTHGFKTSSSATVNVYLIMGSIESK